MSLCGPPSAPVSLTFSPYKDASPIGQGSTLRNCSNRLFKPFLLTQSHSEIPGAKTLTYELEDRGSGEDTVCCADPQRVAQTGE